MMELIYAFLIGSIVGNLIGQPIALLIQRRYVKQGE